MAAALISLQICVTYLDPEPTDYFTFALPRTKPLHPIIRIRIG
jgi:hypothetical protein